MNFLERFKGKSQVITKKGIIFGDDTTNIIKQAGLYSIEINKDV